MVTIIPSIPQTSMDALCSQLSDCQSPIATVRQAAEQALVRAQGTPGFLPQLLQIAVQGPPQCQLQAAILLKNTIQRLWIDTDNAAAQRARITEEDRGYLKGHLIRYLVDSPLQLQKQLAACVTVIASHDFPAQWQNLLPELLAHLSAKELSKARAVLTTLQDITQPYRYKGKGDELWTQIKYVLVNAAQPLLECLIRLATELSQCSMPQTLNELITVVTLLANVFLSLSFQDIPEQFEDKLSDWMGHWLGFLTMARGEGPPHPVITEHEEIVDPPQPIDDLQGVICEIGSLYAEKYEEEFRPFVPNWVAAVYQLLITVGSVMLPRHDPVMVGSLHFMTQIVSRPWNKHLFAEPDRLRAICESIIMPNLTLQQQDIAMFHHNPIEYVRRDSEGSDHSTRRRLTCDLVRALTVQFQSEISQCLYSYVTALLQNFQKSPDANWVQADAAMYVVLALAVQGRTQEKGATIVNQHVNVAEFYQSHVQPQLADSQIERFPILKADAIKFVSTFRSHFPVEQCRDLIPVLSKFLASQSFVVHSYAASAIERLLALKNCITKEHMQPIGPQILTQLFSTLDHEESSENDYVLRALMRVLYVCGSDLLPFLETLLSKLTSILVRVSSNPRNPMFNHMLFECIAILLRICKEHPELVPNFQAALFPPFQTMLQVQEACNEFGPYVFQIMCIILDFTPGDAVPPAFEALYPMLMSPALWESQGTVHAITQLLQSYLRKPGFVATLCPVGGATAESSGRLTALLGVFQKLIASTLNDKFGMSLLRSMIRHVPWAAGLQPYMKQILVLVFTRATSSLTAQFGRAFALFVAEFVCVRGFGVLLSEMEGVQAGISLNVIGKIFLPQASLIVQPVVDRKLIQVSLIQIACHHMDVIFNGGQPYIQIWAKSVDCLLDQLEISPSSSEPTVVPEDQSESILEHLNENTPAYSAAYSRLAFAARVDADGFPQITNVVEFFVKSLSDACRTRPGQITSMMASNLPPARVSLIHELCKKSMVQLA